MLIESLLSLQYLNGNDLSGGLIGYLSTSESKPAIPKYSLLSLALGVDTRSSTKSITNTNYNGVLGSVSSNGTSNGTSSSNSTTNGSNNGTTTTSNGEG